MSMSLCFPSKFCKSHIQLLKNYKKIIHADNGLTHVNVNFGKKMCLRVHNKLIPKYYISTFYSTYRAWFYHYYILSPLLNIRYFSYFKLEYVRITMSESTQ